MSHSDYNDTALNDTNKSGSSEERPVKFISFGQNLVLKDHLGRGGFGTVYRCLDNDGNEHAVKIINTKDMGIPCLIEASIMASYKHRLINSVKTIISTNDRLYLLQDIAEHDLSQWRELYVPTEEQVRSMSHNLIEGCLFLHRERIIHGDLKAQNILIYKDMSIKITDFTLSIFEPTISDFEIKQNSSEGITRNVYTTTHRPLEAWLRRRISTKSDIWALGCTIFELVYGYNLFRRQDLTDDPNEISSNKSKDSIKFKIRDKSINALIDWHEYSTYNQPNPIDRKSVHYYPPELPNDWKPMSTKIDLSLLATQINEHSIQKKCDHPGTYVTIVDFLRFILRVREDDRPTAQDLLTHEYYSNYPVVEIQDIHIKETQNRPGAIINKRSRSIIKKFSRTEQVSKLALEICRLTCSVEIGNGTHTEKYQNFIKGVASLWMATKIIYGDSSNAYRVEKVDLQNVIKAERAMAGDLKFRIHRILFDEGTVRDQLIMPVLTCPLVNNFSCNHEVDTSASLSETLTRAKNKDTRQSLKNISRSIPEDIFSFLNLEGN